MRRWLILSLILLIGCSSAPPERSVYLLRDQGVAGSAPEEGMMVGIGRVSIPTYLDGTELIVQVGPNEFQPARYHQWGEPLDDGIRQYLRAALVRRLGYEVGSDMLFRSAWDYRVDVTFDVFHGGLTGGVQVNAGFVIFRVEDNAAVVVQRIVADEPLRGDGYAAMVKAHTALLDRLADEIAAALGTIQQ